MGIVSQDGERSCHVTVFAVSSSQLEIIEADPQILANLLPKDAAVMDCGEFGVLIRKGPEKWLLPVVSDEYPAVRKGKLPKPTKLDIKVPKQLK